MAPTANRRTSERSNIRTRLKQSFGGSDRASSAERRKASVVSIERFEDLRSWQEARKLMQIVYRLTARRQFSQDRGLRWQVQEAAVSSMGNIAEAHGRYSFEDKRRLLDIALGSCKEVQSHLYVALDQDYVMRKEFDEAYRQADVVAQLLNGSIDNLDRQIASRKSDKPGPRRKGRWGKRRSGILEIQQEREAFGGSKVRMFGGSAR